MVDHGYNPEYLTKELEKIYSQIMIKIRFKKAFRNDKLTQVATYSSKTKIKIKNAGFLYKKSVV